MWREVRVQVRAQCYVLDHHKLIWYCTGTGVPYESFCDILGFGTIFELFFILQDIESK